jgi:iron(III) transport system substrate-binding protein
MEQLVPNCVVMPGSDPMFKAVKDGELPVGFINEDLGSTWKAQGLPVEMIYAKDAVTIQMDACGLVKGGPNPELGKLVIDFLCSKEAHAIAVNVVNRRSARKDVAPPKGLPDLGSLSLYAANEPRQVVNAKFSKISGK